MWLVGYNRSAAVMTEACIVGWAHSPFGKLEDPDVESLIGRVAGAAIEDAGIAPGDDRGELREPVQQRIFGAGFSVFPGVAAPAGTAIQAGHPFENACASGSAAVHGARDFLAAGRGRFALVIGVEKMTATPGPEVGDILLKASYKKEESEFRPVLPAYSAGSPNGISSAMAISPMRWRQSRRRTTRTASPIRMRRCARIWGSSSAAR